MIVLDASAVLEVVLSTPAAAVVYGRLSATGETLHAPHLLDLEVLQVLRRYCATGEITLDRAKQAVTDYLDFPITRYSHDVFAFRIWELRHNLTAYDGAYVALAEALSAPLITRDRKLAATSGHRAVIEVV
ncbi:MAG TPA: type II toxin-antitoxin system VapC family toxin [Nitrospiraceae bacterium]|nr:type II toxin-antitoxin system VapC family toxin [Nitrospiraceae bacterium]